jgi:hypothetical protein
MMATMTGTDRKAFKSELRAALRRQALGIPQPTQADVLLLWTRIRRMARDFPAFLERFIYNDQCVMLD